MLRFLAIALLCASCSASFAWEPIPPISLHSKNPHYFYWHDATTILVTSGEHYGAVLHADFDFQKYLAELEKHGLNHTRLFSGTYREVPGSFGITDNPLAPPPEKFMTPWPRGEQKGALDGAAKFDLSKWNGPYFDRLHAFMREATDRNVVVEFNFFCPMYEQKLWDVCPMNAKNNLQGIGDCPLNEPFTLKHPKLLEVQLALVRKIVDELKAYDNLYYEVCNEPYFGGVTMEWQHRIIDEIVAAEKSLPIKHLISLNIANGRKKVEKPHPEVSIFNFHYCHPPDTVAMNYDLQKVIGENETGFRGREDRLYRSEAWDFLLAGGAIYNNLDYSFTPQHSGGTLRDYKSPGGGGIELRQQLGILKKFMDSFDLLAMKPDRAVVKGATNDVTWQALAERGKQYGIYLHAKLPEKPKKLADHDRVDMTTTVTLDLPPGNYTATWIDTKTGTSQSPANLAVKESPATIESPKFTNDIALRIRLASPN